MNEISKLANISGGATLIGEPSWGDVIPAIEKADDLDPADKRHLPTSLRQMALYLGRPLTMIPTRIAAIGPRLSAFTPPVSGSMPRPSPTTGATFARLCFGSIGKRQAAGARRSWTVATGCSGTRSRTAMRGTCCRRSSASFQPLAFNPTMSATAMSRPSSPTGRKGASKWSPSHNTGRWSGTGMPVAQ